MVRNDSEPDALHFMFYKDGTCAQALGESLEEDRAECDDPDEAESIVLHVRFGPEDSPQALGYGILVGLQDFAREAIVSQSALEALLSKVFHAAITQVRR
ncbi:MAG TPA: hypothetical protein VJJ22_04015 [Candidatus Paceibacterota bacterium]